MKTAEEFINERHSKVYDLIKYIQADPGHEPSLTQLEKLNLGDYKGIESIMVEFAKYHVEKALEAAKTGITITYKLLDNDVEVDEVPVYIGEMESAYINRDSILNAYPLDNIK